MWKSICFKYVNILNITFSWKKILKVIGNINISQVFPFGPTTSVIIIILFRYFTKTYLIGCCNSVRVLLGRCQVVFEVCFFIKLRFVLASFVCYSGCYTIILKNIQQFFCVLFMVLDERVSSSNTWIKLSLSFRCKACPVLVPTLQRWIVLPPRQFDFGSFWRRIFPC